MNISYANFNVFQFQFIIRKSQLFYIHLFKNETHKKGKMINKIYRRNKAENLNMKILTKVKNNIKILFIGIKCMNFMKNGKFD
jgi:hypothetical protein